MFRYLLLGLLIYWIVKRIFRVSEVVKNDTNNRDTKVKGNTQKKKDNHGGEYIDYREVE